MSSQYYEIIIVRIIYRFKTNGDNLSMVETSEEGKHLALPNVQKNGHMESDRGYNRI